MKKDLTYSHLILQIIFATIKTKGLVTRMLGEQQSTSISNTKSDYWKDKHWNDTNGLLWFVQVGIVIQLIEIVKSYLIPEYELVF